MRAVHDPGKVIADLAVTLALGGDCLADIAALRAEPALFGPVASDPVVSRLVSRLAADAPRALKAIRAARAAARERAWALAGDAAPGADGGLITVDIDATVVTSCSEKDQATPTWKKTFGFHPLTVFADHGAEGSGEPLAILLRPGNAGSNTASEHIEATTLALAQLPRRLRRRVLLRADSGGGTHDFLNWLARPGRRLAYSVGFTITDDIQDAILDIPARRGPRPMTPAGRSGRVRGSRRSPACWTCRPGPRECGSSSARNARIPARSCGSPTSTATGSPAWPPAPAAGSSLTWNYATGAGPGARTGSAAPRTPACATCPCTAMTRTRSGARSSRWPASCWPGPRCSPSPAPARRWEPRKLRLRIFSAAGRIVRGGRRLRLRIAARWPWASQITAGIDPAPGPRTRLTSPKPSHRPGKDTRGPVEPRPPGATAGQPALTARRKRRQAAASGHQSKITKDPRPADRKRSEVQASQAHPGHSPSVLGQQPWQAYSS